MNTTKIKSLLVGKDYQLYPGYFAWEAAEAKQVYSKGIHSYYPPPNTQMYKDKCANVQITAWEDSKETYLWINMAGLHICQIELLAFYFPLGFKIYSIIQYPMNATDTYFI